MSKQVSTPVIVIVIVIVVAIIAAIGWKYFGSTQENVSPQQQIQMMKHMKPPNTGKP